MSLLTQDFKLTGQNDKKVIFTRPYLNDQRELMFLFCSEFNRFPNLHFVLNEEKKAIEIRQEGSKRVYILLRGMNDSFYEQALNTKNDILDRLRKYTQALKTGKEKIYVFETGIKDCPYYFTSITILECGEYSIKFEKGLMYFLNEQGRKEKPVNDFMEMQKLLSEKFSKVKKDRYKVTKNEETYYEMTFGELYQIA
ncbi:hypothetical protein ACFVS2_21190 [Brevibacillus sp. NPDC058079]|uniref:hypothetical protein n=1 Tax=Brevibacillus sp. NPDC058079 TaxID=3346330 RepID=UPI0036E7B52F